MTRAYFWKFFSGKLIQNRANSRKIIFDEFRGVTQNEIHFWTSFPEIGLAHAACPRN